MTIKALAQKYEYMFGPAFLISPVLETGSSKLARLHARYFGRMVQLLDRIPGTARDHDRHRRSA